MDASQKWAVPDEVTRSPHAARQAKIGDKPPLCRVPVAAQIAGRLCVPKVDVMGEGGERIANRDGPCIAKSGRQCLRATDIHQVGDRM